MSWQQQIAMMSPAQERQFWLNRLKTFEFGMAVNCRHAPILAKNPVLRQLIKDGLVLRRREGRWGMNSSRTVVYLPEVWAARQEARNLAK